MMYDECLEAFEMGNSDLQESLHILLTQTSRDVYGLPLMIAGNHISSWVDDFEGDPIPLEWQSRYKNSWNLVLLIGGISNLIKCNQQFECMR